MLTVKMTEEFSRWLDKLRDKRARAIIAARLRAVGQGNLGDWAPVGGNVSELRVHYGPGYRLYFVREGSMVIVMLAGGRKLTQSRDIQRAKQIASELGESS